MLSGLAPGTNVADMKSQVLSALQADVASDALDFMAMDPPQISVESEDDFELCREIKERGRPTGSFEVLEPSKTLKDSGLTGWEAIFLQIRDRSSGKHISIMTLHWCYNHPPMITPMSLGFFFNCFTFVDIALKWASPNLMYSTYRQPFTNHILTSICIIRRRTTRRDEQKKESKFSLELGTKLSIFENWSWTMEAQLCTIYDILLKVEVMLKLM